jgi:hypothetical protein
MSPNDESLRAALQQVRRRANLCRDAALALTLENAKESDLPGVVAALQESFTGILLALAEHWASKGGASAEVTGMHAEWPADSSPEWPPDPRQLRPWKSAES